MRLVLIGLSLIWGVISCDEANDISPQSNLKSTGTSSENDPVFIIKSSNHISLNEKINSIKKKDLLNDFAKPLESYPLISSSKISYGKDGLLYRVGMKEPFTGRVFDQSENGISLMEASFLDGVPHGIQLRRNELGTQLMEAIFDRGVLTGVKTKWWGNGQVREEEYWNQGMFIGKNYGMKMADLSVRRKV